MIALLLTEFGLFSSKKAERLCYTKHDYFCLSAPSSVSRVKYVLFVTIKRGVCIGLLVNTKTLFISFKTVMHHHRATI